MSRRRIVEPSVSARTTMSSNCSVVVSRPSVLTDNWNAPADVAGGWLIAPAATCRLAARSAATTSLAVRLRDATLAGSSQTRMA